jgi:hypothetical protein
MLHSDLNRDAVEKVRAIVVELSDSHLYLGRARQNSIQTILVWCPPLIPACLSDEWRAHENDVASSHTVNCPAERAYPVITDTRYQGPSGLRGQHAMAAH